MKIVSPMMTPTLKKPAAVVAPTIGARSTASGMNGSGARRHPQREQQPQHRRPRQQAQDRRRHPAVAVPPHVIASISASAAHTISRAPSTSSLCGRSWRGSFFSARSVIHSASKPIGRLIQKIMVQCT